jgi:uncharacterized phiE125 gp8 family phage protein
MLITKVKSQYPLSLTEVKQHLRIDITNTEDDDYLVNNIIKSATRNVERYIDRDIAYTTNTLIIEDFYGDFLRVNEANLISITDVSINGILYSDYELEIYNDHFNLDWDGNCKGGEDYTLVMHFITGYNPDNIPDDIKQAILIKCGDLYDQERNSYTYSNLKKSDAVERLLMSYCTVRW